MSKGAFRGTASTVGVKQGRLFSRVPTFFKLYIDEVADYIIREGGEGIKICSHPYLC